MKKSELNQLILATGVTKLVQLDAQMKHSNMVNTWNAPSSGALKHLGTVHQHVSLKLTNLNHLNQSRIMRIRKDFL